MRLWVFKIYDGVGGITYEYSTESIGADLFEQELNERGIEYKREDYASVYDFLAQCEEVCEDSFTDGEALEYVLEVIRNLGV